MECTQTTWRKLYPEPPCESHQSMVHHMKSRNLVPFLFKNEEILKDTVTILIKLNLFAGLRGRTPRILDYKSRTYRIKEFNVF